MNIIITAEEARKRSLATRDKATLALPLALEYVNKQIIETAETYGRARTQIMERDLLKACKGFTPDIELIRDGMRKALEHAGYIVRFATDTMLVTWHNSSLPVEESGDA